jgi:anti-anti-sigma factor
MEPKKKLPLSVAINDDDVIVIVNGDATMKISHILKKFMMDLMDESKGLNRNFKIDLRKCNYMDSTFTGILIILEKHAKKKLDNRFVILNPSNFCYNVLETMGLIPLFKISNEKPDYEKNAVQLKPFYIKKTEEAILMYLAHKELSDVSKENKEEFKDVQKFLKSHIESETGKDIEEIDVNDLSFLEKDFDFNEDND